MKLEQLPQLNPDNLKQQIEDKLAQFKEESPEGKLGFITDSVMFDGIQNLPRNLVLLARYQRFVQRRTPYRVVSVLDFIGQETLLRLIGRRDVRDTSILENQKHWEDLLASGKVFTDLFMGPQAYRVPEIEIDQRAAAHAGNVRIHSLNWKRLRPDS